MLPDLAYSFETKIIMAWKLFEGDCLEIMPLEIEDKSIDLIVLDPPYNIKKAKWDKFKSHEDYLEFIFKVIKECERVLKDNGSLYIWHNDFQVLSDIQYLFRTQSDFQFKQLIVWNKRFNGAHNKGFLDGFIETNHLRNYQKMSEYLLFYTFQDESGLSKIFSNKDCFKSIKDYMRMEKRKLKENKGFKTDNEFNDFIKDYCGCASVIQRHYFADSQWCFPVEHLYKRLQSTGFFKREYEDLRREYEDLRREYEDLRREYEDLRYTFNNQKTHHSVWDYQIEKKIGHITPKPIKLCENIIKHSSNHNDKVLIPFAGSGSEMIAGHKHNRNVIGIEKEPNYCDIIRNRLSEINLEQYQPERVHKPLTSF